MTLRSASVRYANVAITRLMITNAWIRLTYHSACIRPSPPRRRACSSPACSSATRATPSTSLRLTRARSSTEVPFERTRDAVAGRDPAALGVRRRELDLGLRPQELKLADPLDGGAGEERAVAVEPQLADEALVGADGSGAGAGVVGASGAAYGFRAGSGAWRPISSSERSAKRCSASSCVHERRRRPDLDAEARGELGDPGELVGAGRKTPRGAAAGAGPRGSSSCRRARAGPVAGRIRSAQPRGELVEHRDHDRRTPPARRARARSGRRRRRRPRRGAARSAPGSPRPRRPRPPRRRRPRARSASRGGGRRRSRACPRSRARGRARRPARRRLRPGRTRRGPRAPTRAAAGRASFPGSRARRRARRAPPGAVCRSPVGEETTTSAPRRLASLIQRSTIGARSTTGSSPTTTTSSASAIAESGSSKAASASEVASGSTAECAPTPPRSRRPSA